MHSRPICVAPLIVVNGSITVSCPISTSTSITVAAGSTMPTPARMCRSWIAACASARTRASASRSLTPSTSRSSSTRCAATAAPSARSRSSTCGRYSSPCALSVLRRGSVPAQRALREREDARVHLADLALRLRGVAVLLRLHHPQHRPARIAHHAPVARRIRQHRRHHRRRRAALEMRLQQLADRLCAHQRHVAAQHHHRRRRLRWSDVARREHRDRRAHRAAGAVRLLLHRQLHALRQQRLERSRRRVHHHHPPRARLERRAHRPQHHRQPAQLVHHLRRAASACACPGPQRGSTTVGALTWAMVFQRGRAAYAGRRPALSHTGAPTCESHCRTRRSVGRWPSSRGPISLGRDACTADV